MVKIIMFVYVIFFLSLFLFGTNINGKSFFILLCFLIKFLCYNLSPFINILIFYFIIVAISECEEDRDCPRTWCFGQFFVKCIANECICVHEDRLLPWIQIHEIHGSL